MNIRILVHGLTKHTLENITFYRHGQINVDARILAHGLMTLL